MKQIIGMAFFIALCACEFTGPIPGQTEGPELASAPAEGMALPPDEGAAQPLLLPEDVSSIAELPGTWFQPFALPGQVSWLTLDGDDGADGATGTYAAWRSCGVPNCTAEAGTYHAVPENPAIGFAFLLLDADDGAAPDAYVIDRLWRNLAGELAALELRRVLSTGTFGPKVVLWRLPEPDTDGPGVARTIELAPPAPGATIAAGAPGLAGVYVRALPVAGDVGAITLGAPAWSGDVAAGTFEAAMPYCLPWCLPQTGSYALTITNPVTGAGTLELDRGDGDRTRYLVLAIWRNGAGQATAIQLQRLGAAGVAGPAFTMYWQWWTPSEVEGAVDGAACGTYRALESYFHIRALQCAYSACFPMSPVYGYWSEYYGALADAVCPPDEP